MDPKLRTELERAVVSNMDAATKNELRWGHDDCALFAVEPIRQVLGYDAAKPFRGRYKTKIGASRVLGRGGLAAALRAAAKAHRWRRIKPDQALPGDLGLVRIGTVYAMTVCRAQGWFVGRAENGVLAVPSEHQVMAWSVG